MWILPHGVLSGTSRLSSCRPSWLDPQQTWSQAPPQTDRCGHERHRRTADGRSSMLGSCSGGTCTTTTRNYHPSPEHRTSPGRGRKKGATPVVRLSTDDKTSEQWTTRYEALRTIASNGVRESWSVALVAHQGVIAWMQAWISKEESITAVIHDAKKPPSELQPAAVQTTDDLVTLLTSMVMATRLDGVA